MKGAWVTLATNDSYSLGALVLAHSLKQVGTSKELALLVTPGVTSAMRARLSQVFNVILEVNVLDSRDKANLKLLQRPELGVTFTKLHCWRLTQYDKCVFLDADTLVLRNCDELFEREELSAAPDVGWPDCFNSGVFVYRPSEDTYDKLIQFAIDKGSFDGGDQGLLNLYFSDWSYKDISKHLPFIYNVCSTAFYSYLPAFKQFGKDAKIIHFIGNAKPWLQYFDSETRKVRPSGDLSHLGVILQKWWDIFCTLIHPNLSAEMSGLAGAFAKMTLGQRRSSEQEALEDTLRRQNWEQGNIDYLGKDAFDNIWSKICETLAKGPQAEPEGAQVPAVMQPEIPEPKLTKEKSAAAAVPQEGKSREPEEPKQQPSTDLPVEIKTEPSSSSTSKPTVPFITGEIKKIVATPIETPAVPQMGPVSKGPVDISPQSVLGVNPADLEKPAVVEQLIAAASLIQDASSKPLETPIELPYLSGKAVASPQTAMDTTKMSSVQPMQQEILSDDLARSLVDPSQAIPAEPILPKLLASALMAAQQQSTPPSSPLIPLTPIQPSAPAAELLEMTCPLSKPVSIPVQQKTIDSAEITTIPDNSVSAQPIPTEIPTTKLQTRATSVQIPTDTIPIEPESKVASELSAQEITSTPPVQTQSEVPSAQAQPAIAQSSTEVTPTVEAPIPDSAKAQNVEAEASATATDTSSLKSEVPTVPPRGEILAPVATASVETQVTPNPQSTCPQTPIAPPPRRSGGNKRQGKSKK